MIMFSHRKKHSEGNVDAWLMSYADMITLLLCFFIIYVSTSEPKKERFAAATKGFHEYFGTMNLDSPYDGLFRSILGVVSSEDADQNISVEKTPRGVEIEVSAVHCFAGNTAEIASDQLPVLQAIAQKLKNTDLGSDFSIEVEGYTGDLATDPQAYASNWELAALRAARIVRLLVAAGIPAERLRAISFADTHPLVPNEDAKGHAIPENQARNQRVVIRVEKMD